MNGNGEKLVGIALGERLWVVGGLVVVSAIAWVYTVKMSQSMEAYCHPSGLATGHGGHYMVGHCAIHSAAIPHLVNWGMSEIWMTYSMWVVMMAGMMLPAAIPMVLAFARINRNNDRSGLLIPVSAFSVGYLSAWALFCVGATFLQWWLLRVALLSPVTLASGPVLGGFLLIVAGIYQWTPWKYACIEKCRNPLGFLITHWRPGHLGAIKLGSSFGLYCVGCCWMLMVICFSLGVMNVTWMAALTLFMLLEKIVSSERLMGYVAGGFLFVWGGWMLFS